jgi:hypothetical protein
MTTILNVPILSMIIPWHVRYLRHEIKYTMSASMEIQTGCQFIIQFKISILSSVAA